MSTVGARRLAPRARHLIGLTHQRRTIVGESACGLKSRAERFDN
jgi:hypothetical protein